MSLPPDPYKVSVSEGQPYDPEKDPERAEIVAGTSELVFPEGQPTLTPLDCLRSVLDHSGDECEGECVSTRAAVWEQARPFVEQAEAELAREREATQEWERRSKAADAALLRKEDAREKAEGRVRDLQEERDRVREILEAARSDLGHIRDGAASNPKSMIERRAQIALDRIAEALVGLPEGTA